jgi:hypothetical protein
MSRVDLMKEAIELGIAEKKIASQLPRLMLSHLAHPMSHAERTKEIESMLRPMFQRNIFLERYVNRIQGKN